MPRLIVLLALLALLLPAQAHGRDAITLGAVVSLSGRHAELGRHQTRGYDLAVKQINRAGGVDVGGRRYLLEIVYRDDRSKRRVAAEQAEALIAEGVDFMLGGFSSGLVGAVAEVTEPHRLPLVQGGGALLSLYEHGRRYLFGVVSTIDKYLTGMVTLAVEDALSRGREPASLSLALAAIEGPAGDEIRAPVIELARRWGMRVVLDETLPAEFGVAEIAAVVDRVAALRPDLFLVFGFAQAALLTTQQLAERRVDLALFGTTHCDGAKVERLGEIADYVVCASQWDAYANYPDRWFGSSVGFLVEFELEYGYSPPYQAAQGAATVLTLADALERAGTLEHEAVREALAATDLMTMFGPVQFDDTGKNTIKPMVLLQVQNGRYKVVWPHNVAWTRAVYPAPPWRVR